jgi:flagellar motility protein MotE (MotC chaperone)
MDPITFALIALGAAALITIVFFFLAINNAIAYQREVEEANRRMEELRRKVEDEAQRLRQVEQESKRREIEDKMREVEELRKKIKQEKEQWEKETSIATAIVEIAANPSISNIVKLIRLIYESIVLRNHIKDPENATSTVRHRVDEFIRKAERSLDL